MKRTALGAMALLIAASSVTVPSLASAAPYSASVQYDRGDRHGDDWRDVRRDERDYRQGYKAGYRDSKREDWRRDDRRWRETHWRRGDYLPSNYRSHYREIDWRASHYREPPRGYHYVRDDRGETLLVGIATGAILGVILAGH